jgi:glycogen debranching enzyme
LRLSALSRPRIYALSGGRAPQAWASGAFALLQVSLGIEQDPFANVMRFSQSDGAGLSR